MLLVAYNKTKYEVFFTSDVSFKPLAFNQNDMLINLNLLKNHDL